MEFSCKLLQKHRVDVFVAGGGPAGVAAAVACARHGSTVYFAEASGCFGGMGTIGLVPEMMNFDDGKNFLAGGIGREVRDALFGDGPNNRQSYKTKVEVVKRLYDDMVIQSGVHFSFFTKVVAMQTDQNGHIEYAVLSAKDGLFAVKASVYVDCTGDGDMSVLAGADHELGGPNGETNPATLCSLWANVDFTRRVQPDGRCLKQAIEDKVLSYNDCLLPGIFPVDLERGVGGGNVGHCFSVDPTDEDSLTKAMIWGRKSMVEYEKYYKEYLTGFENMALCVTADTLGIRESRRIVGDKQLKAEHYFSCAVFEDEIGRYSYPIDIHLENPSSEALAQFINRISNYHDVGESYGIPYGTLIPKRLDNLLVAGRCISADRQMQASIRVIPGCFITGQAAGVAASLAAKKQDVRKVNVKELQQRLLKMGAFLPNA